MSKPKPATVNMVLFNEILRNVYAERLRQEQLRANGKFIATCATTGDEQMSEDRCFRVLGEEFGEVAQAIDDLEYPYGEAILPTRQSIAHLREELIQVASVCVSWIERLDYQTATANIGAAIDAGHHDPTLMS